MSSPSSADNEFLSSLPADLLARLEPHLERMSLELGTVLHEPGDPIGYFHFPIDCVISLTITMRDGKTAEVAMAGRREFAGAEALQGDGGTATTTHIVQAAGECFRIPSDIVLREFEEDARFRAAMLQGLRGYLAHLSQNAACNALHSLEQRLARWLLECRSRVNSDTLRITQQFIAEMLGVRRAGVSESLSSLEERKLVAHSRGSTTILDAQGLEESSCECFRALLESDREMRAAVGAVR